MIYKDSLYIDKPGVYNYTEIHGHLSISCKDVTMPKLKKINWSLSVYSNASLTAEALTSVGRDLYINSNASLPALTSIGGYLVVFSNASLSALTSVGGHLYISFNASLPALTSVDGGLDIYSNVSLTADNLKEIKVKTYIYKGHNKNKEITYTKLTQYLYSLPNIKCLYGRKVELV